MNKELQDQLVSLIGAAKQAGGDTYHFIQQQAPDVIHQLIVFNVIDNVSQIVVSSIWIFIYFLLLNKFIKKYKKVSKFDNDGILVGTVAFGILGGSLQLLAELL